MLIRIVKLGFREDFIETFLDNFESNKEKIRGFKGCNRLELYRDKNIPTQFFTYSYWDDEESLDRYRSSELFKAVWAATKKGFDQRPEAWSVDCVESLP